MAFHVGQKVCCVDDTTKGDLGIFPKKGEVYTIKWIGMYTHPIFNRTDLCFHLQEIDRPINGLTGHAVPYLATRFRPAVERKTDISIFREILNREKVDA